MQSIPITAITGFIAQRWRLDTTTTLLLSQIIGWGFTLNVLEWNVPSIPWWSLLLPIVLGGVLYVGYRVWIRRQWITLEIYNGSLIHRINNYILEFPDRIQITSQYFGSPHHLQTKIDLIIPNTWARLEVGEYTCQIQLEYVQRAAIIDVTNGAATTQKETREYIPKVTIRLQSLDIPMSKFTRLFERLLRAKRHQESKIALCGHQIDSIQKGAIEWIENEFYQSRVADHHPDQIISTYFYKYRDQLIQSAKTAMDRRESWNIILHGPKGTGKSHLVTTLATYFRRDIRAVDLRLINRPQLLKILANNHTDSIIVLDEFDYSVAHLAEKEQARAESVDINGQTMLIEKRSNWDELRLHDLLGIFQGPIPYPKMMIIATTNKLSYIEEQSDALIRPGRLTPWEVNYIDSPILQQIIDHYFPDTISDIVLPESHKISTSLILEYAKSSLGDYQRFRDLLQKKIDN